MLITNNAPKLEDITEINASIEEMMDEREVPMKISMQFSIAVDEIYSNIVYYSGATTASVEFEVSDREIMLVFRDNGMEYDPMKKEDPKRAKSIEECKIGGLGIFIVKKFMDLMEYRRIGDTNVLTMKKYIS